MFSALDSAISSLQTFVESFDPESLSKQDSLAALERFCRAEKLCAAGKALASRQVAASDAWYDSVERSPAHLIAKASGSTVKRAADVLETAQILKQAPGTEQAFRRGKLSESQAIEVASAVALDPDAEQALLEAAGYEAFRQLQRECDKVRAAAMDERQRYERAHRKRNLASWVDREGIFHLKGQMTPKAGAVVLAALQPFRTKVLRQADSKGRVKDSDGAVLADALVEMAEQSRCGGVAGYRPGPQALVHLRVDLAALLRGHVEKGEECVVPEVGPISVAEAKELVTDSFLSAILCHAEDQVQVAHMGRTIPERLRTALVERDQKCVIAGCDKITCLEFDHVTEFARGGPASLANLVRMCSHHHALKTHHGYRLERVGGRWTLIPPDDLGDRPVQPELSASGLPIVRHKPIRRRPGTAPPKKKKRRNTGRPAPWQKDPFEALFEGHEPGLEGAT